MDVPQNVCVAACAMQWSIDSSHQACVSHGVNVALLCRLDKTMRWSYLKETCKLPAHGYEKDHPACDVSDSLGRLVLPEFLPEQLGRPWFDPQARRGLLL